ncbi:hypothetical protein PIB30_103881 [Stylosanthes scabra]|uniref:Uncharacterized protein n=1 Tax=Stylosanthes scabra TaxID=79078 RepID=A0ABU6VWL3_9FABA|nr:hypothetical protein [Stylosanthes scabra]
MGSFSNPSRRRRGKAPAEFDGADFDAFRFKFPYHQQFYQNHVALKGIIFDTRF